MSRSELVEYLTDWLKNTEWGNNLQDKMDAEALNEAVWYLMHDWEIYSQGRVAPVGSMPGESRMLLKQYPPKPVKKKSWKFW